MVGAQTLGDVGEFGFLDRILGRLPQGPEVLLGPGDDAAVLDLGGTRVVACTDVLVEGSHFRRDWSSAHDVGRKAVAVNVADVAAMGARPVAVLAGVAAPAELAVDWLTELAEGLRDEAASAGCSVVGGDTVAGPQVSVTVTALGLLDGPAVTRSGARAGDVVAVCGRLGHAAAGLAVLQRGFRSPRALVDVHRCPSPPYAAGPQAREAGASAMIDVSDGLLADLGHVCRASSVAIELDPDAVEVDPQLQAMARGLGVDARAWVYGGGEDHALAACFADDVTLPQGWARIGRVLDVAPDGSSEGLAVSVRGWQELPEGISATGGYQHFAR